MFRLLRAILRALSRRGEPPESQSGNARGGEASRRRQEDVYSSASVKDELNRQLRENSGYRKRTVHEIGDFVSSDGIAWDEEQAGYFDGDVQTEIVHRQARRCSCGEVLGYGNTNIIGICVMCGRTVCTRCSGLDDEPKAPPHCEYCSALTCRIHTLRYRGRTYCVRHRLYAWWLIFWGCK